MMRGELSRYLAGDRDAGKVVGVMAATRRSSLVALGLQRRAKELGREDYIEAKASSKAQQNVLGPRQRARQCERRVSSCRNGTRLHQRLDPTGT